MYLSSLEAGLDVDYTVGMASGVPVTFLSVGPNFGSFFDGILNETQYLLAQPTVPNVLTTSYGLTENGVSLPYLE